MRCAFAVDDTLPTCMVVILLDAHGDRTMFPDRGANKAFSVADVAPRVAGAAGRAAPPPAPVGLRALRRRLARGRPRVAAAGALARLDDVGRPAVAGAHRCARASTRSCRGSTASTCCCPTRTRSRRSVASSAILRHTRQVVATYGAAGARWVADGVDVSAEAPSSRTSTRPAAATRSTPGCSRRGCRRATGRRPWPPGSRPAAPRQPAWAPAPADAAYRVGSGPTDRHEPTAPDCAALHARLPAHGVRGGPCACGERPAARRHRGHACGMDLATLLAQHGGTCTWRELRRSVPRRRIDVALESGAVVRVARGRYALPSLAAARSVALGASATASHTTAALHWGWKVKSEPELPHLTLPRGRKLRAAARAGVQRHWRDLETDEIRDGWVTSPGAHGHRLLPRPAVRRGAGRRGLCLARRPVARRRHDRAPRDCPGECVVGSRSVLERADRGAANPFESVLRALCLQVEGLTVVTAARHPRPHASTPGSTSPTPSCASSSRQRASSTTAREPRLKRDCRRYTRSRPRATGSSSGSPGMR